MTMKATRHAKILELIQNHTVTTQEELQSLLEANGWVEIACRKDYGGNDRAVTARKPCK